MIEALGFSHTDFVPSRPGRLCRGRERWIEPLVNPDEVASPLQRLVISGARFSDDSAHDALRGVSHSGVELASVVAELFPGRTFLAFMEDGHPADIPDGAKDVEAYDGYRAGGRVSVGLVRWHCIVDSLDGIRDMIGRDGGPVRVRGFVPLSDTTDADEVASRVFSLVGMSTLDSPPARYNPMALCHLLEVSDAVLLLHRDKHGPALGAYSHEPIPAGSVLEGLCATSETLLVPFAIPPMLARWDRALSELRTWWLEHREEDFPVPPSPEPSPWERRRRQRGAPDPVDECVLEIAGEEQESEPGEE